MIGDFKSIVKETVEAIQNEVTTIPDFLNGAIEITVKPFTQEACDWVGGIVENQEVLFLFPTRENAEYTRENDFRGQVDTEADCAGYAALKRQGCSYALAHGFGNKSSVLPSEKVTWGRANDAGCIAVDVLKEVEGELLKFLRVFITVSGAADFEDEKCTLYGVEVFEKLITECGMIVVQKEPVF